MWYWEVVFESRGKGEKVTMKGEGYSEHQIAKWEYENWMKKFLPSMYLFRITKMEVLCEEEDE
jgi:hypothetical protein